MPTLPFNSPSEITFTPSSTDLKVFVNGTQLGVISTQSAVTMFVSVSNGQKYLTIKPITDSIYNSGNSNQLGIDTLYYNQAHVNTNAHVEGCSTSGTTFKFAGIGWEDETCGQTCSGGGKTFTNFFDISAENVLKAKMESVTYNGQNYTWMVARYSQNIMVKQPASSAPCYTGPYCYACN